MLRHPQRAALLRSHNAPAAPLRSRRIHCEQKLGRYHAAGRCQCPAGNACRHCPPSRRSYRQGAPQGALEQSLRTACRGGGLRKLSKP
eukprot:363882-Chlamydomonas_euryale.AAC.9